MIISQKNTLATTDMYLMLWDAGQTNVLTKKYIANLTSYCLPLSQDASRSRQLLWI